MVDPELGDRVDDCIDQRRRRADRAGLARPLDPERVGAARHDIIGKLDLRQRVGMRHGVIGQIAGQQLPALRIIHRAFEHRLPNPLRDPAMHLSRQQQRVDDRAEIVHDEIAHDLDQPGLRLDLDLADMNPFGKVGAGGVKWPLSAKPGSRPGGNSPGLNAARATALIVTLRSVPAIVKTPSSNADIGLGGFELVRGDLSALLDQLVGGMEQRGAADRH